MLLDTVADTTIMGPHHLNDIGLTPNDLHQSSQKETYGVDGFRMQPATGSVQVRMEVKGNKI